MDETGQENTTIQWAFIHSKKVATYETFLVVFDDKLKEKVRNATNGKCKFR
jgi:hypothetical protein